MIDSIKKGENVVPISYVLPVNNLEDCLEEIVTTALEFLADSKNHFDLVIIDNGSTDQTYERAIDLFHKFPQITLVQLNVRMPVMKAVAHAEDELGSELKSFDIFTDRWDLSRLESAIMTMMQIDQEHETPAPMSISAMRRRRQSRFTRI